MNARRLQEIEDGAPLAPGEMFVCVSLSLILCALPLALLLIAAARVCGWLGVE